MQSFNYTASVKLVLSDGTYAAFKEEYPGVTDLNIASRDFHDYNECVTSCRTFMNDIKTRINATANAVVYKIGTEVNPVHNNGVATLSKDWDSAEVSRLWIFDETMEKSGAIHAVAQARIFGTVINNYHLVS